MKEKHKKDFVDLSWDPPLPYCTGFADRCGRPGKWRRQNTAYADDRKNWVFMCDECFSENEEHWAEMWESLIASQQV